MFDDDGETFELSGREANLVHESLTEHEPHASEVDESVVESLEERFDSDADGTETIEVDLSREEARIVIAALEERETRERGRERERLLDLRERFSETFGFDVRDPDDESVEPYPGYRTG